MNQFSRKAALAFLSIAAVAVMVLIQGCGDTALTPDTYVGTWTGTWTNTTFSSTGAAAVTVTKATRAAGDLNFAFDLDGNVFGGSNPASEAFEATVAATAATLTAKTSSVYGDVTGTLNGDGAISGSGTNVTGQVKSYTVTGTWSATKIDATVAITFDDDSTAAATLAFTKQ